jgi:hypothetical protein
MKVWVVIVIHENKAYPDHVHQELLGVYKTKRSDDFISEIGFKYSELYEFSYVRQYEFKLED